MDIVVNITPTQGHDRVEIIERSHAILKSIYRKLRLDLPGISKEERLSLMFRVINDSPSSDTVIRPTTLVFGIYLKNSGAGHRDSMAKRANIIREATKMGTMMKARRMVRDSSRVRLTPSMSELEKEHKLPSGSLVVVFREKHG